MVENSNISVIVATRKRAQEVGDLLSCLENQSLLPYEVIVSGVDDDDFPDSEDSNINIKYIKAAPGLCSQRNAGLKAINSKCNFVAFFDDDYIPSEDSLEGLVSTFNNNSGVIGVTGELLFDGINGKGISLENSIKLVQEDYEVRKNGSILICDNKEVLSLYGCNMAYDLRLINDLSFDEQLPLYGWQEDVDFSSRARAYGKLVKSPSFRGVHRGVKHGRTPGVQLGYSQIANPAYLIKKGSIDISFASKLMIKNILANHVKVISPEPWVDRKGRVKGNWMAVLDLFRGTIHPKNVLNIVNK